MEALKYLIIFVYDTVMAVKKFLGDRYGIDDLDEISKKIQCFQDFLDVMSKVDPGYSTVNVNFLLTGFSNQFWNYKSGYSTLNLSFDMIRRVVKVVFIASSDFPRGLISLLCKNSLWPDQTKQQILRKNNEHAQFIVSKLVAGSHEQDVQYISFLFSGEDKFCMNWIGQS